ncbi:hypothetical protein NA57DRAFT_46362 [Rhizodiscina lignyota]|uniref:Anthranilate phosphoribosyltransferase n=1 Tax=Rhizodiscina lignyota TaxID=1504668 RepID=A0A9P4I3T7_9PEZI|nr:hypothetical protein NA57DRAFT_46362 [Rhizodiscina lignyota]
MSTSALPPKEDDITSILPLLKRLWPDPAKESVTAEEIALAISHIFTNSLSPVQTGALLTCLHFTGWDRRADVLSKCSQVMCEAAAQVDRQRIRDVLSSKSKESIEGEYHGGLCDIVGTGGDSHNTFNVSTTSSIVASSFLRIAKHGNRASTSNSGSADLLKAMSPLPPILEAVTPTTLPQIYAKTNYAFLFAPVFHPGMRYVAPIRKELGWRTIFNLLGPLSNPLDAISADAPSLISREAEPSLLEARLIGVARRDIGHTFADALRKNGNRKALVVCGDEEMDEISPAGKTHCWMLVDKSTGGESSDDEDIEDIEIANFTLEPSDFGLSNHQLSEVSPGKSPKDNALILENLLAGKLPDDHPIMTFVLLNTAALLVVSGLCETDLSAHCEGEVVTERGPGGGRWKEGVRRARWAISSGKAKDMWESFVQVTNEVGSA